MSKLNVGPVGVALNLSPDDAYLDEAVELEQLGYSGIWLPGGQIDSLDRIAALVGATTAIPVGSAIISPDVYDAAAVTALYADLQETAPDRFIVGLGGPQQPPSMRALNDYLDELGGAKTPVPAQRRLMAALGPRKLKLARDRCAGAIALLVTPSYTAAARGTLGADSTLVIDQMVVLDTDAARARETARGPLRFLSGVGGYVANFARMGFTEADISDLSDRLVDELIVWGDTDTITERINAHLLVGADHVVLGVLNDAEQPRPIEVARQLAGSLLP